MSARHKIARSGLEMAFERKVHLSKWALLFEQIWPRAWLLLGLAGLFIAVSLAGLWPRLPELPHKIVLGFFGLGISCRIHRAPERALALAARGHPPGRKRFRHPSPPGVLLRGHADSGGGGCPHGGAVEGPPPAPCRPACEAARRPAGPRTDRYDPFALRALLLLGVFALMVVVGDSAADRLWSAFRFSPLSKGAEARLDAWITPPSYTGKPPIMLADGGVTGPRAQDKQTGGRHGGPRQERTGCARRRRRHPRSRHPGSRRGWSAAADRGAGTRKFR